MPLSTSISSRLRHQHEAIPELIGELTERQLRQRTLPDKWSAFEQIAHLAAYQPTFITRLDKLAHQQNPTFERYVADNDPHFHVCVETPLTTLLQDLPARAARITAILTSIKDSDLTRTALHPKYGLLDIPQWTQFYLLHEAHHLFAIFMLTQELRAARV